MLRPMGGLEKGGQLGGAATTQLPRTTYDYSRKRKKRTRFTHITMRYGFVLGSRAICVVAPTIQRSHARAHAYAPDDRPGGGAALQKGPRLKTRSKTVEELRGCL